MITPQTPGQAGWKRFVKVLLYGIGALVLHIAATFLVGVHLPEWTYALMPLVMSALMAGEKYFKAKAIAEDPNVFDK